MLIGYDNFISNLTQAAAQGATSIMLEDAAAICSTLNNNYTRLLISDGTYSEEIQVTHCVGGVLQLSDPLKKAYPVGTCVRYVVSTSIVCTIISQGGCSAAAPPVATPPPCARPSFVAGMPLPDFEVAAQAQHAIVWNGVGPFTVTVHVKPFWMNTSIEGNALVLTGVPPNSNEQAFQATITNACGTTEINSRVCYCNEVGVAE